jgi:hypothetical protein
LCRAEAEAANKRMLEREATESQALSKQLSERMARMTARLEQQAGAIKAKANEAEGAGSLN